MYQKINSHKQVMKKYANKLISDNVVTEQDFKVGHDLISSQALV